MKFLFKTTATMKHYNNKKWWIDSGIIREISVDAENLGAAMVEYCETVRERDYIEISKNALKNKEPMYRDAPGGAVQVGYVVTAKTDFYDERGGWNAQYIDLWVSVYIVSNPFELEAAQ